MARAGVRRAAVGRTIGLLVLGFGGMACAVPAVAQSATETKRAGRTGADIVLGAYLSVEKGCKVGDPPPVEVIDKPAHGQIITRPQGVNIRTAPGAPKNCIGLSPNGVAVIYRSARRFKGEDKATFKVTLPDGVREVRAAITVK